MSLTLFSYFNHSAIKFFAYTRKFLSINLKKTEKKTSNFFCRHCYTGRKNFINEKGLFYAKIFEFEEFSIIPFFVVASSLSILCYAAKNDAYAAKSHLIYDKSRDHRFWTRKCRNQKQHQIWRCLHFIWTELIFYNCNGETFRGFQRWGELN